MGILGVLTTTLLATPADVDFHKWCTSVGIETPFAQLETTPRSVAGRGVFATANLQEGDVAITIPERMALHEFNAALSFPDLAKNLEAKTQLYFGRRKLPWWRRLFSRKGNAEILEFTDNSDVWQAKLTVYALACLSVEDHPWAPWISQWQRMDPLQSQLEKATTWRDEPAVLTCLDELSEMVPDVSKTRLRVAIEMRLGRFEELRTIFDLNESTGSMYGLVTSRAMELGDGVSAILPMFDMLNHSPEPNLALSFDGNRFELWATRGIREGEELFVSYSDSQSTPALDEDDVLWQAVQWGIPQLSAIATKQA